MSLTNAMQRAGLSVTGVTSLETTTQGRLVRPEAAGSEFTTGELTTVTWVEIDWSEEPSADEIDLARAVLHPVHEIAAGNGSTNSTPSAGDDDASEGFAVAASGLPVFGSINSGDGVLPAGEQLVAAFDTYSDPITRLVFTGTRVRILNWVAGQLYRLNVGGTWYDLTMVAPTATPNVALFSTVNVTPLFSVGVAVDVVCRRRP